MPETWDSVQRDAYYDVAMRAQDEVCASYATTAIGLQLYREVFIQTARIETNSFRGTTAEGATPH